MATAYDYYRNNYPGWGTGQLQFRAPPSPTFQPSSAWSGYDYYRAHAYNPDHGLYDSVINRTRSMGYNGGYDMREAKVWQRRVYSGIVNLAEILPADIGAAAAYEAYRMWKHHRRQLFDPLGGASEREREALIGLATAEATRLWAYSGRATDTYGQRDCLEMAALTASQIAETMAYEQGGYGGGGYAAGYDNAYPSRGRRYSNVGQPIIVQAPNTGYPGTAPMPIQGAGYAGSAPYAGSMSGSPYAGGMSGSPYAGGMPGAPYAAGVPAYAHSAGGGGGYPGSYGSAGGGFVPPPLSSRRSPSPFMQPGGSPYMGTQQSYGGAPQSYGGGYGGGAYGQPGYGQSQSGGVYAGPGVTTIPAPAGSTIIISKGRSRRDPSESRHHHHHHTGGMSIRRARSADLGYRV